MLMELGETTQEKLVQQCISIITTGDIFEAAYAQSKEVRSRVSAVLHGYNSKPNTESGPTEEVPGGDYAAGKLASHRRHTVPTAI